MIIRNKLKEVSLLMRNNIVRQDAWFLIGVGILLILGATVYLGLSIWCITNGHGRFTGGMSFTNWGMSVWAECR
jgi:hypothetical protein